MYAVVELQWHQYIVSQDNTIVVDQLDLEVGQVFQVPVLALFSDDAKNTAIWTPFVSGATVSFEIKAHQRGEKIHVLKFKRKNRYERKFGHRSYQTILAVTDVHGK